jgi:porphobilinogen deaminase
MWILQVSLRKQKVEKLTAEDLMPAESSGVIEVDEEDDDEETEEQVA